MNESFFGLGFLLLFFFVFKKKATKMQLQFWASLILYIYTYIYESHSKGNFFVLHVLHTPLCRFLFYVYEYVDILPM